MSKVDPGNGSGQLPSEPANTSAPPQPQPVSTETDKRQDRQINWSLMGMAASFTLALASAFFAYRSSQEAGESNALARAVQDRAVGRVQARFEFVEEKNRDPNRFKQFMRKKDGSDQMVFRVETVDELIRWAPHVRVKNTGDEPIDAMRVDVLYDVGAAYGVGVHQIDPPPIVYNEPSSHEATTFGKLMPGQTARIDIAPLLLRQMSGMKWQDFADKDHIGVFTTRVYCRLVGSSGFDRMEKDTPMAFTFHWRPAGFKADARNVKELLEIKPSVKVE